MNRFGLIACLLLLSGATSAQTAPPPVMDEIVLDLTAERWVETERARVIVSINASGSGADAAGVRGEMLTALARLADKADWRFTSFNRALDQSGMEQWYAQAEARLPDAALDGINDRARQASRPGLQLGVDATDFTPSLAEMEAARAALRADLYRRAVEELEQLNAAVPGRAFRIAAIQFGNAARPMPMMMKRQAMMAEGAAMAMASDGSIEVANKLVESAAVVLAAVAPTQ